MVFYLARDIFFAKLLLVVLSVHVFDWQITVYDRENPDKKYYFPCYQWLSKDEGDGRIARDLTATTADTTSSPEGKLETSQLRIP